MYASRDVTLNPIAPAAWLTLADAKAFIGVAGATDDALITALIAAACLSIESYCARPIAERAVSEALWTEEAHGSIVLAIPQVSVLSALTHADEAQTVGDFALLKSAGMIRRNDGSALGAGKWTFTYTAGFADGSIPAPIVQATKEYVRDLYNSRGRQVGVESESVPDVGEVSYFETSTYMSAGPNGTRLPSHVAAYLEPYVLRFSA